MAAIQQLLMSYGTAVASSYQIQRSLRFRSAATAYLNRTPAGAGSAQKFTYSVWVKRGTLASDQALISAGVGGNRVMLILDSTGYLRQDDSGITRWQTSSLYRDPTAWYHIVWSVDTTQATGANRNRIYVNGVEIVNFSTYNTNSLNFNFPDFNAAVLHRIGVTSDATDRPLDGYLAEVNFVDNQALTPSSFGQTDAITNQWSPKVYAGTYGTNGFYLPFTDTSSTTNLVKDTSGNANNWTPNNISLVAGVTYDSMTDVPLTYGTTDRGNYCTLSPLQQIGVDNSTFYISGGTNLVVTNNSGYRNVSATWSPEGFKGYFEFTVSGTPNFKIGFMDILRSAPATNDYTISYGSQGPVYLDYDAAIKNGSSTVRASYVGTIANTDVIGCAFDFTGGNRNIWWSRNGTWGSTAGGVGDPAAGTNPAFTVSTLTIAGRFWAASNTGAGTQTIGFNFGQRAFTYTPPTGFKALHTGNLPAPTIIQPKQNFDVTLYTGDGAATNTISGVNFQADMTWIKRRSAAGSHVIQDSVRTSIGACKLASNSTASENSAGTATDPVEGFVSAVSSAGFTVTKGSGQQVNESGATYAACLWRGNGVAVSNTNGSITSQVSANTTAGFSIVTYTGTGAAATIGHGLGVAPRMIIGKTRTGAASSWWVYHASMAATESIRLESTAAKVTRATWGNTTPTSSVFSVGVAGPDMEGAVNLVAYCFAEIAGYSKFGGYTGNGGSDGVFVYLGFRPKYVLIKNSSAVADWVVLDSARNTYNVTDLALFPNTAGAQSGAGTYLVDFTANGFKLRTTNSAINAANTYIYAAFAEAPFNYALAR